jgi:hypothetical protein
MFARLFTTLALAAAAGALIAQTGPPVRTGGIGEEERRALESDARYNLKIVAADRIGQYLADVDVQVLDAGGQRVIGTRMAGPWLLAELPPGRYRVIASFDGATRTRDVSLGRDRREVVMQWDTGGAR